MVSWRDSERPAPYVKGNYTDHTVATYYGEAMAVVQADGNGPVKVTVADEERFYVVEIPCEWSDRLWLRRKRGWKMKKKFLL